jgi:hypothetical protein
MWLSFSGEIGVSSMAEKRGPGRPPKNSAAGNIEIRSLNENEWGELPPVERARKKAVSAYDDAAERLLRGEVVGIVLPDNKSDRGAKIALARLTKKKAQERKIEPEPELEFRFDPDRRLLGARKK